MLAKLKTECGYQFTQKMEGMFNDMRLSAEATADYMKKASVSGSISDLKSHILIIHRFPRLN